MQVACGSNENELNPEMETHIESLIESLIVQLADEDDFVASSAVDKLVRIGKLTVPALIKSLNLSDRGKRHFYATQALVGVGGDAVPILRDELKLLYSP